MSKIKVTTADSRNKAVLNQISQAQKKEDLHSILEGKNEKELYGILYAVSGERSNPENSQHETTRFVHNTTPLLESEHNEDLLAKVITGGDACAAVVKVDNELVVFKNNGLISQGKDTYAKNMLDQLGDWIKNGSTDERKRDIYKVIYDDLVSQLNEYACNNPINVQNIVAHKKELEKKEEDIDEKRLNDILTETQKKFDDPELAKIINNAERNIKMLMLS